MPSWDLIIILFFAANILYGFLLRRDSLVVLIISTYLSYLATVAGGDFFFKAITRILPKLSASQGFVEAAAFFVIIILLNIWGEYIADVFTSGRGRSELMLTVLYGVLSAGLIIACFISFLPVGVQEQLVSSSNLLRKILRFEVLWFLLPPFAMIVSGFLGGRK